MCENSTSIELTQYVALVALVSPGKFDYVILHITGLFLTFGPQHLYLYTWAHS